MSIIQLLLLFVLTIVLAPFLGMILWFFAGEWPFPAIWPVSFSCRGWDVILAPNGKILTALAVSVVLSSFVTVLCLLVSVPAARALAFYRFTGRKWLELLFVSPLLMPALSIGIGVHMHFIRIGLADTVMGVALLHLFSCLPYGIMIMKDTFSAVGIKWEQQARVLGAGTWQTWQYVMLPLLAPGLMAAAAMSFIVSFSEYILTFLIGGGKVLTFSLILFPYLQSGDRNVSAVLSAVFLVVILIWIAILGAVSRHYPKCGKYYHL